MIKGKYTYILLFFTVIFCSVFYSFTSCNNSSKIPNKPIKSFKSDGSVINLMTQKQWIFDTIMTYYSGPGTGVLLYVRGRDTTSIYAACRFVYWPDGTEDAFNVPGLGAYSQVNWRFPNNDSSKLFYPDLENPVYQDILFLDQNHFRVYDHKSQTLDIIITKP